MSDKILDIEIYHDSCHIVAHLEGSKDPLECKQEIMDLFKTTNYIEVEEKRFMVSQDFMTTCCPSIIDKSASLELLGNQFKIAIWYDNEWSYSFKIIKLLEHMIKFNR